MDAVVPLQIRRHGGHAVLGQVPRRGDQHRTYLADQRSHMRVGHLGHVPDRQVETLGGQRGQPVAQVQLDLHVRVALEERRNQRRDDLPPQRHRRRHGQHAPGPGRQVLHGRVARLDALERGGGLLDQVRARLCQADAARGAPHQRQPDGLFQLGDALADRGLAELQTQGGRREAAGLGQDAQAVDVRPQVFQSPCSFHAHSVVQNSKH